MKKYLHTLLVIFALLGVLITPQIAHAQVEDVEIIDDITSTSEDADTTTDEDVTATDTEEETAGVPETGIAPTENKAFMSLIVFAGGAALGSLIGLGFLQMKKSKN